MGIQAEGPKSQEKQRYNQFQTRQISKPPMKENQLSNRSEVCKQGPTELTGDLLKTSKELLILISFSETGSTSSRLSYWSMAQFFLRPFFSFAFAMSFYQFYWDVHIHIFQSNPVSLISVGLFCLHSVQSQISLISYSEFPYL